MQYLDLDELISGQRLGLALGVDGLDAKWRKIGISITIGTEK